MERVSRMAPPLHCGRLGLPSSRQSLIPQARQGNGQSPQILPIPSSFPASSSELTFVLASTVSALAGYSAGVADCVDARPLHLLGHGQVVDLVATLTHDADGSPGAFPLGDLEGLTERLASWAPVVGWPGRGSPLEYGGSGARRGRAERLARTGVRARSRNRVAHPARVWEGLDLSRRRAIVDTLATVTNLPARRGRRPGWRPGEPYFDPTSIRVQPKRG